jgi:hypothetical protein
MVPVGSSLKICSDVINMAFCWLIFLYRHELIIINLEEVNLCYHIDIAFNAINRMTMTSFYYLLLGRKYTLNI